MTRVVRMMLQVVASPMIIRMTTVEVSFMLLENIYSTGITNDEHHDNHYLFIVQATGWYYDFLVLQRRKTKIIILISSCNLQVQP